MCEMAKKRVFIAVNLSEYIRSALEKEAGNLFAQFPETVRFTNPESWHFTITFLGDQTDEDIGTIVETLSVIAPQFQPPEITINKIMYGPLSRGQSSLQRGEGPAGKTPRMIWAVTNDKTSAALGEIKSALENELARRGIRFEHEQRKYHGHITLARPAGRTGGFDVALRDFPQIDKTLTLSFIPQSLDLMESALKRNGAEYALMSAVDFAEDLQ